MAGAPEPSPATVFSEQIAHSFWHFLTDFGDTAVTVPLAVAMAIFLLAAKQPRLALAWCTAIVACAATIGALKLGLAACGRPFAAVGLTSPSGHAAMSAAVYGGFAAIIATTHRRWQHRLALLGALLLVVGIALSRLILQRHTLLEVIVGLAVGCAALLVVVVGTHRRQQIDLPLVWLLAAAAIVVTLFHGERWPAEQAIRHLAGRFDLLHAWCTHPIVAEDLPIYTIHKQQQ